ncbi:MAG: nickel-type superoxide dismutase maturation protease [Cyanobacteria bacterium J06600_6]
MTENLPRVNFRELLLLFLRRRKRLKVVGESMLPLLKPGDEIIVNPYAYAKSSPQIDDVVVLVHPLQKSLVIVKRIAALDAQNRCFLLGDNSQQSTDSRHWGTIKSANIIGKVSSQFY